MKPITDIDTRFWPNVKKGADDECWPWLGGTTSSGYGVISVGGHNGKRVRVHRYSYETLVGPVPDGLVLDHLCRNRVCVNPAHLEPVTQKVNLQRQVSANGQKTHCPKGHPLFGENLYLYIAPSGRKARTCKICHLEHCRESDRRKRGQA